MTLSNPTRNLRIYPQVPRRSSSGLPRTPPQTLVLTLVLTLVDSSMGHANSKDDAARFRAGYPGQEEDEDEDDDLNEKFQKNKISSVPDGDLIENIHKYR